MHIDQSAALFQAAQLVLPGGVNSPVRAFLSVGGTPRFMASGSGSRIFDADGNSYLDYVGSWGPLIHGHAPQFVHDAVKAQLDKGSTFGAPSALEVEMAQEVCARVPSISMVRMVSSGTEAVMGAIRVARGFTGRGKIVKFAGCYHGHADALLVQAGSGAMTLGVPDSAGVTQAATADTISANFNDLDGTRAIIRSLGTELACVLVEPLPANMGVVPPSPGFLEMLREETANVGALLVFDEVMTGFRLARGGYQEVTGITPDLTTLGKIIGGGFPVGAYGGRVDIMKCVAPAGPVYQAGTLSGNPIAMTAGLTALRGLTAESYAYLEALGSRLEAGFQAILAQTGTVAQFQRVGSMWTLFFCAQPVTCYATAKLSDTAAFATFFNRMLNQGFYLPPSQFEAAFLSLAHTEKDVDDTLAAAHVALGA